MDKNYNTNMDCKRMMAEFTEAFGDAAVEMTFREVVKGMDSFFGLMGMTIELVNLIHKEEELKKHHRAYLHVRAEIENRADAVMELIAGIVDELNAKEHFYHVSAEGAFPFAKAEDEGEAVTIPYSYYICNVTLENFNLSHVPVYIMGQDELSMYATYMSVLGNREDLFPSSGYVDKYVTNPPSDYEVPAEYLSDERFATLLAEAEKYLGYQDTCSRTLQGKGRAGKD